MSLNLELPRKKTPISLTPLIDVVFILLLFFMLTSNFVQWRKIDTPIGTNNPAKIEVVKSDKFILSLKSNDGFVWLDEKKISINDGEFFRALIQANLQSIYILEAKDEISLQSVLNLTDQLKLQGAKQVSIANAFKTTQSEKNSKGE